MNALHKQDTSTTAELEPISLAESKDLIRLESIVENGLQSFVVVGEALIEIRDRKLYRVEHATFAEYCKVKWKMSDRRARQLMGASEVVADVSKSGTIVPKSESQARPLNRLQPGQRAAAWQEAVESSPTGTPTAREVEVAVVKVKTRATPTGMPGTQPRPTQDHCDDASDSNPPGTPLQWLTHWWGKADHEQRERFYSWATAVRMLR
jgi:hypothetical protein